MTRNTCAGCTNINACNYDPGALLDNGQCSDPSSLYLDQVVDGESTVDCLGRCLNDEDLDGIGMNSMRFAQEMSMRMASGAHPTS